MPSVARLLGLAFASADLLLEMDADRKVTFALGAAPFGDQSVQALMADGLGRFLTAPALANLKDAVAGLQPGRRNGCVVVEFAQGGWRRQAELSLFMLPDLAPAVSCAVRYTDAAWATGQPVPAAILDAAAFLDRAREVLSSKSEGLAVTFLDIDGLSQAQDAGIASGASVARIEAHIQAASIGSRSATRLEGDRFALLRDASQGDLSRSVRAAVENEGLSLNVRSSDQAVAAEASPLNTLRALRFAVEACLKGGIDTDPTEAFSRSLASTLKGAETFQAIVRERRFDLHYQPIVDLGTRSIQHFEALARFSGANGPANVIQMAEELGLIEEFDLAVAAKAFNRLRQPGSGLLTFAVNVSGASLTTDRYVQQLLSLTDAHADDRRRLIVEVTETAALSDMEAANRRLSVLRRAGIRVCIDDFGSGSAAFDYLRGLSVDAVKIDGRFVTDLETDPKSRTVIAHLVDMCAALKLETIAEMIETEAAAAILKEIGVTHGQGWLFGRATPEPKLDTGLNVTARRRGAVEQWG